MLSCQQREHLPQVHQHIFIVVVVVVTITTTTLPSPSSSLSSSSSSLSSPHYPLHYRRHRDHHHRCRRCHFPPVLTAIVCIPVVVRLSPAEPTLVTTLKETLTASQHQQLFAEVEKQYVAVTPPDSPEPPAAVVRHVMPSPDFHSQSDQCQISPAASPEILHYTA